MVPEKLDNLTGEEMYLIPVVFILLQTKSISAKGTNTEILILLCIMMELSILTFSEQKIVLIIGIL